MYIFKYVYIYIERDTGTGSYPFQKMNEKQMGKEMTP